MLSVIIGLLQLVGTIIPLGDLVTDLSHGERTFGPRWSSQIYRFTALLLSWFVRLYHTLFLLGLPAYYERHYPSLAMPTRMTSTEWRNVRNALDKELVAITSVCTVLDTWVISAIDIVRRQ